MIIWNEGLSIGVKTLDDDHKKFLEIINSFSEAIEQEATPDVFETMFSDLEEYVIIHFQKEEVLLKKCRYEGLSEHQEQHKSYSNQISELKEKFFSANNYIDAKDISHFLTDWLIDHIVNEDMKLVEIFQKCGISENKNNNNKTWFDKLIKEAISTFSFSKRMFLSALIPLIGMLILGSIIIWKNYQQYAQTDNISKIAHTIFDVNELSHALQIERGLSSGDLSAKNNKFTEELHKQREIVDNAKEQFIKNFESINPKKIALILSHIELLKKDISTLGNIRKMIDNKTISEIQEIDFYTEMIKNILGITTKIMLINTNKEISYSVSTLSSLLSLKEILGQERAYGTILIEQKNSVHNEYQAFIRLLGAQATFYDTFRQIATVNHKNIISQALHASVSNQILDYKEKIIHNEYEKLDSQVWFELTTEQINDIKKIIDVYLEETNSLLNKNLDSSVKNLILWLIYILLILGITRLIIFIFEKSTKFQIAQFTEGMKHLALGGRSLRLEIDNGEDEISQIYNAYEVTRLKLLKGDIYAQLYLNQEKVKYNNQKRENLKLEEMAFIDSLTGTINRRKFEELSAIELERTIRYGHALSFLMLDIDHFKNINDTYGHAIGDTVLKHFSNICKKIVRNLDVVARIGGEEFVIILPETDEGGAYTFAQRLREIVFKTGVIVEDKEIRYTVSIGIALFKPEIDKDVASMLERADKALYKAKENGRNRVEI